MPNATPPVVPAPDSSSSVEAWWTLEAPELLAKTSLPHALTDLGVLACAVLAKALLQDKMPAEERRKLAREIASKMATHAQPRRAPTADELPAPPPLEPTPMSDEVEQALAAYGLPTTKH